MRLLALAVLLLLPATLAFARDEDDLRALDRDVAVATWTGDVVWFERNVPDDFVLITATGRIKTKPDVIRDFSAGFSMQPYEPTEVQVRVFGTTAIVTGRASQRYTANGGSIDADMRYTSVWLKRRGKWTIVSLHASLVRGR